MTKDLITHGGYREGAGRKPLSTDGANSVVLTLRVTPELKEKVRLLGGSEWMRQTIQAAKLPKRG